MLSWEVSFQHTTLLVQTAEEIPWENIFNSLQPKLKKKSSTQHTQDPQAQSSFFLLPVCSSLSHQHSIRWDTKALVAVKGRSKPTTTIHLAHCLLPKTKNACQVNYSGNSKKLLLAGTFPSLRTFLCLHRMNVLWIHINFCVFLELLGLLCTHSIFSLHEV